MVGAKCVMELRRIQAEPPMVSLSGRLFRKRRPRCVPHGLRKAIMRRLAESGSSAEEIAAISGHRSLKGIERYTAAADRARPSKAAIAKLRGDKKRTQMSDLQPESVYPLRKILKLVQFSSFPPLTSHYREFVWDQ